MSMKVSVILITSPFPSMPSTVLVDTVLESLQHIQGLEEHLEHTYILMDGVKETPEARFKKGRIQSHHVPLYSAYEAALTSKYSVDGRCSVHRSEIHQGFASMVKWGLELCRTPYALILQHDRYFLCDVPLRHLLGAMEQNLQIRYIGFPTANSHRHAIALRSVYGLDVLNKREVIPLDTNSVCGTSLQPLIFWFDSQHLAHVARYLEIFTPRITWEAQLDGGLQERLLSAAQMPVSSSKVTTGLLARPWQQMVLRRGDFLEDRFGQAQRNLFLAAKSGSICDDDLCALFRWFGSYLFMQTQDGKVDYGTSEGLHNCDGSVELEGGSVEIPVEGNGSYDPDSDNYSDAEDEMVICSSHVVDAITVKDDSASSQFESSVSANPCDGIVPFRRRHHRRVQQGSAIFVAHLHGRVLRLGRLRDIAQKHGMESIRSGQHRALLTEQRSDIAAVADDVS